jgi:hypothetical protein
VGDVAILGWQVNVVIRGLSGWPILWATSPGNWVGALISVQALVGPISLQVFGAVIVGEEYGGGDNGGWGAGQAKCNR